MAMSEAKSEREKKDLVSFLHHAIIISKKKYVQVKL